MKEQDAFRNRVGYALIYGFLFQVAFAILMLVVHLVYGKVGSISVGAGSEQSITMWLGIFSFPIIAVLAASYPRAFVTPGEGGWQTESMGRPVAAIVGFALGLAAYGAGLTVFLKAGAVIMFFVFLAGLFADALMYDSHEAGFVVEVFGRSGILFSAGVMVSAGPVVGLLVLCMERLYARLFLFIRNHLVAALDRAYDPEVWR